MSIDMFLESLKNNEQEVIIKYEDDCIKGKVGLLLCNSYPKEIKKVYASDNKIIIEA